jgi:hypothetical protein
VALKRRLSIMVTHAAFSHLFPAVAISEKDTTAPEDQIRFGIG